MENLPVNNGNGQSYGYTLYETIITSGGVLHSKGSIKDRALVRTGRQSCRCNTLELRVYTLLCENICTLEAVISCVRNHTSYLWIMFNELRLRPVALVVNYMVSIIKDYSFHKKSE